MFEGLPRDLPSEFRAHSGRIAIMHAAVNSGVKDISKRLAESVVRANALE